MHSAETFDRAVTLRRSGLTLAEVASATGASPSTVSRWSARTAAPCHTRRPVLDPATVDRTAYAYVLGLYLGDGHISVGRRGVYRLTIYCCDSYPGLVEACASAIHALTGGPVERVRKPGCLAVGAWSKQWPVLFPQHGSGRKHDRPIVLERWQEAVVAEHPEELVRGLLHSDGTRCVNRVTRRGKSYEYTRYFFKNESADIQRIFTGALDLLGVAWRQDGRNQISVARREAVARLDEFVGPKY